MVMLEPRSVDQRYRPKEGISLHRILTDRTDTIAVLFLSNEGGTRFDEDDIYVLSV